MKLLRKRVLVPAALFLAAALLSIFFVLRGTLATTEVPRPSTAAEGPLAALWLGPDGRKVVRAAMVVDRPPDRLWSVITGYERYPAVFPTVLAATSSVMPDGRRRLQATVSASLLGTYPVDILIRHEEGRSTSWDMPTGEVVHNRGSWTLTKLDDARTLVEYQLDVEIANVPDWFVRAVLRGRVRGILRALDAEARR